MPDVAVIVLAVLGAAALVGADAVGVRRERAAWRRYESWRGAEVRRLIREIVHTGLVAAVLAQHRTESVNQRLAPGVYECRYECGSGCGWSSGPFDLGDSVAGEAAKRAAIRHEAEMVAEAIRHGAPEATGSGQPTRDDATDAAVPADVEERTGGELAW